MPSQWFWGPLPRRLRLLSRSRLTAPAVCDAAYHLYRERFLAEKYGAEVIDMTAEPVEGEGFEPRYPEADEEIPSDMQ